MDTKICRLCGTEKSISDFPISKSSIGPIGKGVSSWCYRCCADKASARRAKDPEKHRQRNREWNRKNKGYQRESDLKKIYGISSSKYDSLLISQNGVCAICGTDKPSPNGRNKYFSIDHDHNSGTIRGLLCLNCNVGIGLLKDSVTVLKRAVQYLSG